MSNLSTLKTLTLLEAVKSASKKKKKKDVEGFRQPGQEGCQDLCHDRHCGQAVPDDNYAGKE